MVWAMILTQALQPLRTLNWSMSWVIHLTPQVMRLLAEDKLGTDETTVDAAQGTVSEDAQVDASEIEIDMEGAGTGRRKCRWYGQPNW